jgi:integrase
MKTKLTQAFVNNARLPAGKPEEFFWDDALRGYGLRIRDRGGRVTKSYVARYRAPGHQRRITIGSVEVLMEKQARQKAREILAAVQLGHDPAAEKRKQREKAANTLRSIIDQFLEHKLDTVRANTAAALKRFLGKSTYVGPLAGMPVDAISRRDIAGRLFAIKKEHGTTTAACFRGALSGLFTWAMASGLVEHSPMLGVLKLPKPEPRDRVLNDDEIRRIWLGLEDDDYGKIIKLLVLSGCRAQEIGRARWSEFADDMSAWTLPSSRSKTKKALVLPITDLMMQIIDTIPRRDNDHLFGRAGFTSWRVGKLELDARIGLSQPWQVRDIRRSVSTGLNNIGVMPHVAERILNHALGGVHSVYNKAQYTAEVRSAMQRWSRHIASITTGGERNSPVQAARRRRDAVSASVHC